MAHGATLDSGRRAAVGNLTTSANGVFHAPPMAQGGVPMLWCAKTTLATALARDRGHKRVR